MAARNLVRFTPLDGIPDADVRGIGDFHFDDGTVEAGEDPELADLVKSYQDSLPQMAAQPDLRLASNDPAFTDPSALGADAFGASTDPSQVADFLQNARPAPTVYDAPLVMPTMPSSPSGGGHVAPDAGSHAAATTAAAATAAPSGGQSFAPMGGSMPGPPSDSSQAADLHRMAAQRAMQGSYVPGQKAGYVEQSRTGALDPRMAAQQAQERGQAQAGFLTATEQRLQQDAELKRKSALDEAMRIAVQREAQQREQDEAAERKRRLLDERKRVNDEKIDDSFAQGNGFRQVMALLGASLLGATGKDTGLRMIESNIDNHVRQQMQVRGSKLQALAEEIGSEEQVVAGAKAKLYELAAKETANAQKLYDAAGIEHNIPAVLAELKQRNLAENQEFDRQSQGKRVEVYQQGRAAGRTGPDLTGAAKHYEAASKLDPQDEAEIMSGLDADQEKDFRTRMEGIADAEHALNEIDQNIGIQRDKAGNIINKKDVLAGNIEGAGAFGGRTPDGALSEKGSSLNRSVLRMTRAAVKATNGSGASNEEFERAEKDTPLTDEKDLINALDEKRRELANAKAKAQTLYRGRVDRYLQGYGANRARIGAQRGQTQSPSGTRGQMIQLDSYDGGDS